MSSESVKISHLCDHSIGLEKVIHSQSGYTAIESSDQGIDTITGYLNESNNFIIHNGSKTITGGDLGDRFIFRGAETTGKVDGGLVPFCWRLCSQNSGRSFGCYLSLVEGTRQPTDLVVKFEQLAHKLGLFICIDTENATLLFASDNKLVLLWYLKFALILILILIFWYLKTLILILIISN